MELRGTLRDFSLEAILGLIQNGRKSGRLHLVFATPEGGSCDANLLFADGDIRSAQCGPFHGLDALREAVIFLEGSFEFAIDAGPDVQREPVLASLETALATMNSARDEMTALRTAFPTGNMTLKHAYPAAETITISPREFRLLALLHDGMSISDIIAAAAIPTIDAMRTIQQLTERGLLATGPVIESVSQMDCASIASLAEFVGGNAGVGIFNQYFRPGATVTEWSKALPAFRSAFQILVGTEKTNQVIAGIREIIG
jgi:hypothetical protein